MDKKMASSDIRKGKAVFLRSISRSRKVWLVFQNGKKFECVYNKSKKEIERFRCGERIDREVPFDKGKVLYNRVPIDHPVEVPVLKPKVVGWKPVPKITRGKVFKNEFQRQSGVNSKGQKILRRLMERDGDKCTYCQVKVYLPIFSGEPKATIDHVIPKSKGGKNTMDNFVLSCPECNQRKADTDPDVWMRDLWGQNLENCPHEILGAG